MPANGWIPLVIIVGVVGTVVVIYYGCLWWALRADRIRVAATTLQQPLTRAESVATDITSISIEV